ncbi:MAG TPA: AAA family ATPase [Caulobacteraceae bacterium]|nr:AAA family ATPase [Caulobacteraceae bacterium]
MSPELQAWLAAGAGSGERCQKVVETSISWVFLYRDRALKLKKPVDFGFLDFTTAAKRGRAARRELEFNRALAPSIYRAVRRIVRTAAGLAFNAPGETVDWAVEMRRFDEADVLASQPHTVAGEFAEALGRRIARLHAAAPAGKAGGGARGLKLTIDSNARQFAALPVFADDPRTLEVLEGTLAEFERLAPVLEARLAAGYVRRCHGDLHLGNIVLENGEPTPFDCIEFNDAFSDIDVLYDLAFLTMDLGFRDERGGANRVLNGWLDEAARAFPPDLWDGLAALPLFQSVRATVRAHVLGHAGEPNAARAYLEAAGRHLRSAAPTLTAVGGLSGSGKTSWARHAAPALGPSPGAVVLRTDEIRKRLASRPPTERLPRIAYTREADSRVYQTMFEAARACLAAGWSVVLDGVFLDPGERAAAQRVAAGAGAPFDGVWLEAPAEVIRARLMARGPDASDADAAVLAAQLARDPGPISWRRLAA